jgi:hypothetical protein
MAMISGANLTGDIKWQGALMAARGQLIPNVRRALTLVGQAVSTHAKLRVPVSKGGGVLRKSIRYEVVGAGALSMQARIGTNEDYGVFVEYGTDRIAGGKVKALGLTDEVGDFDAIHTWPALEARGGSEQQMPWLRPAARFVEPQARVLMQGALNGTLKASGLKLSKGGGTM